MNAKERAEKKAKLYKLSFKALPKLAPLNIYFNFESNEMLDEKIEVFEKLINGVDKKEIKNLYDILENYKGGHDKVY